ncbi:MULTISPECIES: OpgC domain-containing protein [unclassified Bradyrhizobium]|uniref:OpgC domain-containing protein n=1 Tax=unclassified Bradyrhizobium TaxID=2631580 RepID=UPI001BA6C18B|nr:MULTISPECIES: OpgC domain-containing protein [unclassified Bradyrhizobium]MBR1230335.1 OpgC domain-containing protein [Bradyrhizobium sp. AUGA SZCCT0176]MBR1302412.1 OpgC domain-containing protein [Bradyrhizobium sp. AUGA SZCCT0042]
MFPSMKAEIAARDGDPRLSLLLGIAAWFLFLDHIPHNAVSLLTLRNFGFSGATDLFVFVGGYTAAILYGKMMLERGFLVTATRIFRRVWQLYAAYVVLFVIYIDLIGYVARKSAAPEIIHEFNVAGILGHTIRTLIYGLLLQAKPLNLDVLQLFIVLMAFFPVVLFGMLRRPNLTAAGSIVLYLAARKLDWNLSSFPDGHWYFNPFAWQLLFVLGAWFALGSARQMRAIRSLQDLSILRILALLYLLFALIVTVTGNVPQLAGIVPDAVLDFFLPNEKENLAPYRVLHFLTLAFLFSFAVPRDWHGFQRPALRPIVKCGEEWLPVFCAGVFLSFAGHFFLITGPNSLAMHFLVSIAGIAIMAGVAYYTSWSRRQDYKPALSTRY